MEYLLDQAYFKRYYNCSSYDYESIPRNQRRKLAPGIVLLFLYALFEVLYVPCLWVFSRKDNRRESCYMIMLAMGSLSLVSIHSSGLIIGIYSVRGDAFCDRPLFNYVIGMVAFGFYCAESIMAVMLALNRCIEMWEHRLAERLFEKGRVRIWLASALVYGAIMGIFTKPPMPNGMFIGWFWNPHVGYVDDTQGVYPNIFFSFHNMAIGFGLPVIYVAFYALMRNKVSLMSDTSKNNVEHKKGQKNVYIQVLLISVLHSIYCVAYVVEQYFPPPLWLVYSATFAWIGSQGSPSIIYLLLNRTVRTHLFGIQPPITTAVRPISVSRAKSALGTNTNKISSRAITPISS